MEDVEGKSDLKRKKLSRSNDVDNDVRCSVIGRSHMVFNANTQH